jgi:hypothetical protein
LRTRFAPLLLLRKLKSIPKETVTSVTLVGFVLIIVKPLSVYNLTRGLLLVLLHFLSLLLITVALRLTLCLSSLGSLDFLLKALPLVEWLIQSMLTDPYVARSVKIRDEERVSESMREERRESGSERGDVCVRPPSDPYSEASMSMNGML